MDATIRHTTFIPQNYLMDAVNNNIAYQGDGNPSDYSYDREEFRTRQTILAWLDKVPCDSDAKDLFRQSRGTGVSVRYMRWYGLLPVQDPVWINGRHFYEDMRERADPKKSANAWVRGVVLDYRDCLNCCVTGATIVMKGVGYNPVGPAIVTPAIDYHVELRFERASCNERGRWTVTGAHDGFPSHALFIDGAEVYSYDASAALPEFLFGDDDMPFGPVESQR